MRRRFAPGCFNEEATSVPFQECITDLLEFVAELCAVPVEGLRSEMFLFVICGNWDVKTILPQQSNKSGVEVQIQKLLWSRWCNLKDIFRSHYQLPKERAPTGMRGMLNRLKIALRGQHHLGMDDVSNLAEVLKILIRRGADISATGQAKGFAKGWVGSGKLGGKKGGGDSFSTAGKHGKGLGSQGMKGDGDKGGKDGKGGKGRKKGSRLEDSEALGRGIAFVSASSGPLGPLGSGTQSPPKRPREDAASEAGKPAPPAKRRPLTKAYPPRAGPEDGDEPEDMQMQGPRAADSQKGQAASGLGVMGDSKGGYAPRPGEKWDEMEGASGDEAEAEASETAKEPQALSEAPKTAVPGLARLLASLPKPKAARSS